MNDYGVDRWVKSLPTWKRWVFAVLSAAGQRERAFEMFGYYRRDGLK